MTQELLRDDSLPYREYIVRPGEILGFGFEWCTWLANRWQAGVPVAAGYAVRPRRSTGFEYFTSLGGFSGAPIPTALEPVWPTMVGTQLVDGAVTWLCQPISTASLASTIGSSSWSADSPLTVGGATLSGTRVSAVVTVPDAALEGDYYVRNSIILASGEKKIGTLLMRVRIGAVY